MALQKEIELDNGVITKYHRIVSITKVTNQVNTIEVGSYTSEAKRQEEQHAIEEGQRTGEAVPMDVFINTIYIDKEYNEKETIEDAYKYLKTLDEFKGAKDC